MSYKEEFIKFMIESDVLRFGQFTLKSGRSAPYFVNTGLYRTGEQISRLGGFYASCIAENVKGDIDALFGPAYKGIPLSVATAIALYNNHGINVNYCFDRKEEKDHGEGGKMVGYQLKDGDRIVITEDVVTSGKAFREVLPKLKAAANVEIAGMIISVDRMEKGTGERSAAQEITAEYGIPVYSIVNVREIIETMHNKEIGGRVVIDDAMREQMENYLAMYGAK